MKNRESFIDAIGEINEKYLTEHVRRRCPPNMHKIRRYVLAAGVYAAAILAVAILLPFVIGNGKEPEPTVKPNPPIVSETDAAETDPVTSDADEEEPPGEYSYELELSGYMDRIKDYFHTDSYKMGDDMPREDILGLVFSVLTESCFDRIAVAGTSVGVTNLDFVEFEDPYRSNTVYINGEDFRKTAKLLFGEDFDVSRYHDGYFRNNPEDFYDEKKDLYTVQLKAYSGGGEPYSFETDKPIDFNKAGDTAIVTAGIHPQVDEGENITVTRFTYKFDKVIEDGVLYYRLTEVVNGDSWSGTPLKDHSLTKMPLDTYMRFFVNYFHGEYKQGDPYPSDVLSLVFNFCGYAWRWNDSFDFIEPYDRGSVTRPMGINGADFTRVAKNLLGEDFDPSKHRDYMKDGRTTDRYDLQTDTYIADRYTENGTFKDSYGYLDLEVDPDNIEITETDTGAVVTVKLAGTYQYLFEKVEDEGFTYYRILSVDEIKSAIVTEG